MSFYPSHLRDLENYAAQNQKNVKKIEERLEQIFNLLAKQSKPTAFDKDALERNDGFMPMGKGLVAHITHQDDLFVTMHLFDFNLQIVTTSTDYGHTAATHVTKFTDMPSKAIQGAQSAAKKFKSL